MTQPFRLLTEDDVRRALAGVDLVQLMEDAVRAFSERSVVQPVRTAMFVGPDASVLGLMPAHLPDRSALGSKLVTVFNSNSALGLPTHFAVVLLFDDRTGALRAIMDGSYITEARTPAVSGVAVRHLANGPVRRLALIGCGVQARSHLRVLATHAPSLEEVRVCGPEGESAAFARDMRDTIHVPIVVAASGEAATRHADLIVLVTSSATPVIRRAWVDPGSLVISVGACRRDHREMDPDLVANSRLFVDSREAALVESGDIVQAIAEGRFTADHVRGELGDVVSRRVPARESDGQVVVFKSLGIAVEDVAVADLVYRRAIDSNAGQQLSL